MKNKYKIYAGGEFIETNKTLLVRNPFNNKVIAETYLADYNILENAVNKALNVEKEMKNMPSFKKYEILRYVSNEFVKDRKRLAEILSLESGKPIKYALGEIDRASQTLLIAAEESKRLPKEYISLDWTPKANRKEGLVKYFPIGLTAGISPFNFPMNLAMHKIAPAIAAGCPIILKPARSTPLSVLEFARIIDKTDLPKGAVSIIPADRIVGNNLVTDNRFKMISFTGSPEIGWQIKNDAGKKKVVLELGGNAGVAISDKANLDLAIKKCITGAFAYSGQVCIHTQRIFVLNKNFEVFTEKFIEETKKLKFGDPLNSQTDISVMIDEENALRVENWVNESVSNGAKILHGGKRKGLYFEPTIITNSKPDMKICSDEIFGPVVVIEKVESIKEAVNLINDSEYGLQAGIFSDSIEELNYAFENIEAGAVISNDIPTFRVDNMPYGGIKNSGFGREGVKYSIREMLEPKLLVKDF